MNSIAAPKDVHAVVIAIRFVRRQNSMGLSKPIYKSGQKHAARIRIKIQ